MENRDEHKLTESRQGLVTFMDVLGWKGVYYKDENAIDKLLEIVKCGKEVIKDNVNSAIKTKIFVISDTIIILSYNEKLSEDGKDLKKGRQLVYHAKIAEKIINKGVDMNILLRGATSYGKYSFSNEELIFMGEAIDEAAEWHENTDWCGVILTPKAQMELESILNNKKNFDKIPGILKSLKNYWINYDKIPLKSKNVRLRYALNWNKNSKAIINKLKNSGPYTVNISGKYLNTIDFIEYISKSNDINKGDEVAASE